MSYIVILIGFQTISSIDYDILKSMFRDIQANSKTY